ncbi:MAG: PilW family protein [Thiogranum sp.]|jgi:type IV pilus assembly protein PilW|nr:PilW family protein [Thiogranum sp.]
MNRSHTQYTPEVSRHTDREAGFSLVELMVAMTISLFLLAGVVQIFLGSKQSYRVNDGVSRLQENARFAFDRIAQDLDASGYMGCNDSADVDRNNDLLLTNALTNAVATGYNFANPLDGTDNTGPNGSDTLNIRRAVTSSAVPLAASMPEASSPITLDNTQPNYASLEQWQVMAISDCSRTSIFMITNDPTTSGGVIQHDPGVVAPAGAINEGQSNLATDLGGVSVNDLKNTYGSLSASQATAIRVATNSYSIQPSDSGTGFSLALNGTELVEGVQDLQVLYGIDADGTPGVERYVSANDAALAAAGMNQVAAVTLTLTLNAVSGVQIDGTPLTKTVSQTFRLRNR